MATLKEIMKGKEMKLNKELLNKIEKELQPIGYNDERDVFEMGEWAMQYGQLLIDEVHRLRKALELEGNFRY